MKNYTPILNPYSTTQNFKKFILKRIMKLPAEKDIDFTGEKSLNLMFENLVTVNNSMIAGLMSIYPYGIHRLKRCI